MHPSTPPQWTPPREATAPDDPGASPKGWTHRSGKVRPMILLWALGVPIPIILVILLMRGCFG